MYRNDMFFFVEEENFDTVVQDLKERLTKGGALSLCVRVVLPKEQILSMLILQLRIPYKPATKVMKKYGIAHVREFVQLSEGQILRTDGVGRKSLNAFKEELAICGLHFGMVFEEEKAEGT